MTSHEYLEAMRNFLLTAPFSAPYENLSMIDYGEIIEQAGSDGSGNGNAIMLTGDSTVNKRQTITGREIHTKRVNFALILWRDSNDNTFRRDIGQFLIHLIQWINEENAKRQTTAVNPALPRFSNYSDGIDITSADGGIKTAALDEMRSEYSVQIHQDYQLEYRKN